MLGTYRYKVYCYMSHIPHLINCRKLDVVRILTRGVYFLVEVFFHSAFSSGSESDISFIV